MVPVDHVHASCLFLYIFASGGAILGLCQSLVGLHLGRASSCEVKVFFAASGLASVAEFSGIIVELFQQVYVQNQQGETNCSALLS